MRWQVLLIDAMETPEMRAEVDAVEYSGKDLSTSISLPLYLSTSSC